MPKVAPDHIATLAFQKSGGEHTSGFGRIEATVDGQTYSFLLDTGAHTLTTAAVQRMTGLPNQPFATSFISKTIAGLWHQRHPDWLYVDGAEALTHEAMIRVPQVRVGGYTVGPVWFTVRPDKNFSVGMARYMDAPIVGALGGSALRYFRLTVDYHAERAYFERP